MGFSYFVLEVLTHISEMFIHVKTSENLFFNIVKGFRANFYHKSSYTIAYFCLFPTTDCCNPVAFPKSHWDFPIGMISHEC